MSQQRGECQVLGEIVLSVLDQLERAQAGRRRMDRQRAIGQARRWPLPNLGPPVRVVQPLLPFSLDSCFCSSNYRC